MTPRLAVVTPLAGGPARRLEAEENKAGECTCGAYIQGTADDWAEHGLIVHGSADAVTPPD